MLQKEHFKFSSVCPLVTLQWFILKKLVVLLILNQRQIGSHTQDVLAQQF